MQPNPLINPYNQSVAALMQGLLAEQLTGAALPLQRMSFSRTTIPDPALPNEAIAHYLDLKRSTPAVPVEVTTAYERLNLQRYAALYPRHMHYLPWGTDQVEDVAVLNYVQQNFNILLVPTDVSIAQTAPDEGSVTRTITVTPVADHPIWYGQLQLWAVPAADLRSLIARRVYTLLDVTALSA